MDIFSRNIPTVSPEEQKILSTKTAFVAGCGGLGGFIIEYLVRLGVGHIIACDADVFSESNLNRQILSTVGTLGKSKVREAEKRARSIVPDIRFDGFEVFLDEANACELMKGADIAMDALDNPSSRVILAKAAAETGIPMVHGAVGGQHLQVSTVMPGEDYLIQMYTGAKKPDIQSTLSFVPPACAAMQVSEALKVLTGKEPSLKNRLLAGDLERFTFDIISFE